MYLSDTIALSAGERFAVGHSSMAAYADKPERFDVGMILICRRGSARLTVDVRAFNLIPSVEMVILPGKIIAVDNISSDFEVEYFIFSREMFEEASFRMDLAFFKLMSENPYYKHNEYTLERFDRWIASIQRMYEDREHMFRDTIMRNLLQNVFLNICDTMRRHEIALSDDYSGRQGELFHKYMTLVREHFRRQHNVSFYAAQMCITTRYLSTIVRNVAGESPKDVIDRMLVLELKVMLRSTNMAIQEIASLMHFPDQSYLGRYFRKHTGMAPTEYRNKR